MYLKCLLLAVAVVCASAQSYEICSGRERFKRFKEEKYNCDVWTEWTTKFPCNGPCGGGHAMQARTRTCKDKEGGETDCVDRQERLSFASCVPDCHHGKFDEERKICQCPPDFKGTCCDVAVKKCANPNVIRSNGERSSSYKLKPGKPATCDWLLQEGWYRAETPAGNLMPTTPVKPGLCNTKTPFWLNGTHPNVEDEVVDRVACGYAQGDPCKYKIPIQVQNCSNYMSYYLKPVPLCYMAFCFGTTLPCPEDQSSPTGFEPGCTTEFPKFKIEPEIEPSVVETVAENDEDEALHEVAFKCRVKMDDPEYLWRVEWEADGKTLHSEVAPYGGPFEFVLPENLWTGNMGKHIQCFVRARNIEHAGTWSKRMPSKQYYAGIEVSPSVIDISETDDIKINLRPTIPVRCAKSQEDVGFCRLEILVVFNSSTNAPKCPNTGNEIAQIVFPGGALDKCSFNAITSDNWNESTQMIMYPKMDFLLDGAQTRNLLLIVRDRTAAGSPDLWKGYRLPPIKITVRDSDDTDECSVVNDPHITAYKKLLYDFHYVGEYTVYENREYDTEIQGKFYWCGSNIACICGVGVRIGTDYIQFDRCAGRTVPVLSEPFTDNRAAMYRKINGEEYIVYLPTGTRLKVVFSGGQMISFYVKPSPKDKGNVKGLCGTYGDNLPVLVDRQGVQRCSNVLGGRYHRCTEPAFVNEWKVPPNRNIFTGSRIAFYNKRSMKGVEVHCDCVTNNMNEGTPYGECDYDKKVEKCASAMTGYERIDLLKYVNPKDHHTGGNTNNNSHQQGDSNTVHWDKAKALEYCRTVLTQKSKAVKKCLQEVPNQDYTPQIEACALDILLTNSTFFTSTHLESSLQACSNELNMNISVWEPKQTDGEDGKNETSIVVGPPVWIVDDICENDCSGHGYCKEGKCVCDKGFEELDCSVDTAKPPSVITVEDNNKAACDLRTSSCSSVFISGNGFLPKDTLTCFWYSYWGKPGERHDVKGEYISKWEVKCPVPTESTGSLLPRPAKAFNVTISNDGHAETGFVPFFICNTVCQECDFNKLTCITKKHSCNIQGKCYVAFERDPSNPSQWCDPSANQGAWSDVSNTTDSTSESPFTTRTTSDIANSTSGSSFPTKTSSFSTATDDSSVPVTTGSETASLSTTIIPSTDDPEFKCSAPYGSFVNPADPNQFYKCSKWVPFLIHCGQDSIFDDKLKICVKRTAFVSS